MDNLQNTTEDILRLQRELSECREVLTALGNETRQYLLCCMLSGPCGGCRVIDLEQSTHLSWPAISRHMSVLKKAGIVSARKEGTMIYYFLDPQGSTIEKLLSLMQDVQQIMSKAPDRRGEL